MSLCRLLYRGPRRYLAESCDVTEGAILDDLVALAWVAQLGVALHGLGGQADTGGLAASGVWGEQVVVPLEDHQLALGLSDVRGERRKDMTEHHVHLHSQLSTCGQAGGQLHLVEFPTETQKCI